MKEIINNSSCVSLVYIADTLKEDLETVKSMCCDIINSGFPAKIDDIDNIVYSRKINKMNETINKTIDFCNRNYLQTVNKIISNISARQPKLKDDDFSDKQIIHLEKKLERGNSGLEY
jgi:glycerol-3-phosphate cytidylyltransferase-like family protein